MGFSYKFHLRQQIRRGASAFCGGALSYSRKTFACVIPREARELAIIFEDKPQYIIAMLDFLPPRLACAVRHVNLHTLYELRIRAEKPLTGNVGGAFRYLSEAGICGRNGALVPTREEVEETLFRAADGSLHTVENQLRAGFVTAKCGERIGVAGRFVYERGEVLAVREISSLCVRVPHEIFGCAAEIYRRCFAENVASLLVLSPPGEGKTTILRDLSRLTAEKTQKNILVCDERGELSAGELGDSADVIRFAEKQTAFTAGIRALRPEVIVTDELLPSDYEAVKRAIDGGICVFASAHLTSFEKVPQKLFSYYVLLDGLGRVGRILDENGRDKDGKDGAALFEEGVRCVD